MLFKPGQRHSYRAAESAYTDCWMHISSDTPLLFEGFPFGKPLPLRPAERFYRLFGTILDEFYAVRARVQTAEELLVSSADSVEHIAERCGYNNTEHFIRQFRARTGTTPTGYRKNR